MWPISLISFTDSKGLADAKFITGSKLKATVSRLCFDIILLPSAMSCFDGCEITG
jgi:hypothetical protein